jgi:hypothetical protein
MFEALFIRQASSLCGRRYHEPRLGKYDPRCRTTLAGGDIRAAGNILDMALQASRWSLAFRTRWTPGIGWSPA